MIGEVITYKGMPTTCEVQKQLELQRWILNPSSMPYDRQEQRLVSRSASTSSAEVKLSIVEKQLALQRMIIIE